LPKIYNAVHIIKIGDIELIVAEVQYLIGKNKVRAICMISSDGLKRGDIVFDTENSILVPVGKQTLGRIFNVLGKIVDQYGELTNVETYSIHRLAPDFVDLDTKPSIFETEIKVIDLLAPYKRGGKIGLIWWCRSRKNSINYGIN